ncbi:MAG TPA: MBL fold metallo-hydrolase [Vicinamibacterales bacterium]|nr:MBL fold metallo-hydrolase [Vicinamibacterales bacterium]
MTRLKVVLVFVCALIASGYIRPAPKTIEVAKGVYLFVSKPYGDVGLDGNSIAILSDEGVLVFDSNGTPASSAAVLAEIRKLTDKPVKYIVNSHWHWDHWYGTETYTRAFPDVKVVAHEKTRAMMAGPALDFNRPGLEAQLPGYIASLEKRAATDPAIQPLLEEDRFFLNQKKNVHLVLPTQTFDDKVVLRLGTREIHVLHVDRAVTPGDAFVYLPAEKIVITGDLLVNPVSFALSCYPTGWLRTLEKIDGLDASIIVPGHGEPLHDKSLLRAHMSVMRQLLKAGKDAKARGLDPDQAREEVLPRLHDLMVAITGDDPKANEAFRVYLVDWYMHRVYDELNGPLTDAIAPIPPK